MAENELTKEHRREIALGEFVTKETLVDMLQMANSAAYPNVDHHAAAFAKWIGEGALIAYQLKDKTVFPLSMALILKGKVEGRLEMQKSYLTKNEISEFSGFSIDSIERFMSLQKFPHIKYEHTKKTFIFFDPIEVTEWIKAWEGDPNNYNGLINGPEVVKGTGRHWETVRKYINSHELNYVCRRNHAGEARKFGRYSFKHIGRGYWFDPKDVEKWKKKMDGDIEGGNKGKPKEEDIDKPALVDVSHKQNLAITSIYPDKKRIKEASDMDDVELEKATLELLIEELSMTVTGRDNFTPLDINNCVMTFKLLRDQYNRLKTMKAIDDTAEKLNSLAKVLKVRVYASLNTGLELNTYHVRLLTLAFHNLNIETDDIKQHEVGDSGYNVDDMLAHVDEEEDE